MRILAADLVQWFVQRKGTLCVFPDTNTYWFLAGRIRNGEPFEVLDWGEIPRFALRTPGYPLFLAVCRFGFGDRPIAARLVQAGLGAVCVWLVFRLAAQFVRSENRQGDDLQQQGRRWTVPLMAAGLVAFNPYFIVTSALILTEAVFIPLMLVGLWALAVLWTATRPGTGDEAELATWRKWAWALGGGMAWGAAVMVRPSWALFVPLALLAWVGFGAVGWRRLVAARWSAVVTLGAVLVMAPWWVRNERLFGRFVPTAIWGGASLYDGLNPQATGASDMDFMNDPALWPLDEETQDAVLRNRALDFARARPGRALGLAVVKFARYWSPWPNAESFHSPLVAIVSASFTIPLFLLLGLGVWDRRGDLRALVLLAGPLLYFCALHMVFASSMRYRIPAEPPAMVLAAIGLQSLIRRWGAGAEPAGGRDSLSSTSSPLSRSGD